MDSNIRKFIKMMILMAVLTPLVLGGTVALAKKSNPPGPEGGPGASPSHPSLPKVLVQTNPPGSAGGPGTDWWVPKEPYAHWRREKLLERLQKLREYRNELMAGGAATEAVASVTEQITKIEEIVKP